MHCIEVHFLAVPQCSSRHRDRNTTTATNRNADAVDYERSLRTWLNLITNILPGWMHLKPIDHITSSCNHVKSATCHSDLFSVSPEQVTNSINIHVVISNLRWWLKHAINETNNQKNLFKHITCIVLLWLACHWPWQSELSPWHDHCMG